MNGNKSFVQRQNKIEHFKNADTDGKKNKQIDIVAGQNIVDKYLIGENGKL